MAFRKSLYFLLQTIMAGLAAAFIYVLLVQPALLHDDSTVIELTETPQQPAEPPAARNGVPGGVLVGPVSYADAVQNAAPAG